MNAPSDGSAGRTAEDLIRALTGHDRTSMIDLLRVRSKLHGDARFLTWRVDDLVESWTYEQAWTEVERTAAGWRQRGLEVGDRVASFAWNSPDVVWAWLGALGAGATFVPINRHLRGALLADQMERVRPRFVVADSEGLGVLKSAVLAHSEAPVWVTTDAVDDPDAVAFRDIRSAEAEPISSLDPSAVGLITFTSGSTGRSKAVRLSNHNLIRSACAYASPSVLDLTVGDVLFGWNPLFHLGALIPLTIASGAECALYPGFSASRFWQQVNESGATYVEGFPVMIDYLLNQEPDQRERTHRLRTFFVAGYDPVAWVRAEQRFGVEISNVAYDMSETGLVLFSPPGGGAPAGSCGIPYPGWEVALVADDRSHVVGAGAGEMVIRPTQPDLMFEGYEGDAEATVAAWRDLWFHTGDWMERDADGHHFLRGRMANRIRRRGENVSEEELLRLLRMHPHLRAVAVVAMPSKRGEHDIKVAVEPHEPAFDLTAFVGWCRAELPRFMMPRYFEIWSELPVLPSAKVDVVRLRTPAVSMVDIETDPRFQASAAARGAAGSQRGGV